MQNFATEPGGLCEERYVLKNNYLRKNYSNSVFTEPLSCFKILKKYKDQKNTIAIVGLGPLDVLNMFFLILYLGF